MDIQLIAARVRRLLAEQLGVPVPELQDDKRLDEQGGDSLDAIEAIMGMEDEFDLRIEEADEQKLATQPVREWVQYITARMAAKAPA